MPWTIPFFKKVPVGNATFSASIVGEVRRPQEKNSRNITTVAWNTLGLPYPCKPLESQPACKRTSQTHFDNIPSLSKRFLPAWCSFGRVEHFLQPLQSPTPPKTLHSYSKLTSRPGPPDANNFQFNFFYLSEHGNLLN